MDAIKEISISGYNTYFQEMHDGRGNYLAIAVPPEADKSFTVPCGELVAGHLIQEIDYHIDGKQVFVKAYY